MSLQPFSRSDSRILLATPIFNLRADTAARPDGAHEGTYYVLECPAYVNVVALTDDGRIILVRQWRHGTRSVELEIPAGLVEAGESGLDAAARELLEETGFSAARWSLIGQVAPNAAMQDNFATTVLAEGCTRVADPTPDAGEDLEIVLLPLADLPGLVRDGTIRTALPLAGLFWWLERGGRIDWPTS